MTPLSRPQRVGRARSVRVLRPVLVAIGSLAVVVDFTAPDWFDDGFGEMDDFLKLHGTVTGPD